MGFVGRAAKRGGMHMTRKLLSFPLILITTAVTMAFGFYSDRPYAVNPNPKAEPLQERLSQWAGAGFWLALSFVLALNHPLWGLPAVMFAAFVVMRRIAASRGFGWPVASMRREVRLRLGKPGLSVVGLAATVLLADGLGLRAPFTELNRSLCFVAIMGAAFWVGVGFAAFKTAQGRLHFLYDNKLAAILGVSEALVNGTGLQFSKKAGELSVFPLPPQAAFKRGDIEAKLRQVAPEWEYVAAKSGHEKVVLASASFETEQRRATLEASGGLIVGVSRAAAAKQDTVDLPDGYVDTVVNHAALSGALDAQLGGGWNIQEIRGAEAIVVRGTPDPRPSAKEFYLGEDLKLSDGGRVAKNILKTEGLVMVAWDPEEDLAIGANLLPSTVELRERLARELGKEPWQVELSPHYAGGELKSVTILRHDTKISGDRDKRIAFWLDIARNTIGHSGWFVLLDSQTGRITMKAGIKHDITDMAGYDYEAVDQGSWGDVPIGIDGYGGAVQLDLASNPHTMVVGKTNSGKSVGLRAIIFAALVHGWDLVVIDPTKRGLDFTWARGYVRDGGWGCLNFPEAQATIEAVYAEGKRRLEILVEQDVEKWTDLPEDFRRANNISPIMVVIDEFTSLAKLRGVPKLLDDTDQRKIDALEANLAKEIILLTTDNILREMRFVGIHVAIGTQVWNVTDIGNGAGGMRTNMGNRLQFGRASNGQMQMAFSDPSEAAEAYELAHSAKAELTDTAAASKKGRPGRGIAELDGVGYVPFHGSFATKKELAAELEKRGIYPRESILTIGGHEVTDENVVDLGAMELSMDDLAMTVEETAAQAAELAALSLPVSVSATGDQFESGYAVKDRVRTQSVDEDDPFAEPVRSRMAVPALDDDEDPFAEVPFKKPAAADKFADFSFD